MLGISPETSAANSRQASGITLRDVVFILFRRRWVVLAVCLPIILLGGTSLFQQTGSFTASAKVVVELTKVDLPQWDTAGRNINYDREMSTLFTIAMSVPVAEKAAGVLSDSLSVIKTLDPNLVGINDNHDFAEFLLGGLDVSAIGESNVLEFRFTSVNPRISIMAVGALRDAFVEYQIHGRKNKKAVQFYVEQMNGVRAEIDSLLAQRGQIMMANHSISLKDEMRNDTGLMADLEADLNTTTVNRKSMQAQYDQLVRHLKEDPRDFPMGPDENKCSTLIYWRNLVGKHDDELASMLTVYNPDSDVVQRQRGLIQDTVNNLAREEASYVKSLWVALQAIKDKEVAIRTQMNSIQAKNLHSPIIYQKVSLIDTEIASLSDLLKDVQGKLGEVRLSELADERVSNVVPLTNPEMAAVLSGSKTIIYFVMIVIFAIALGVVAAFILESLDHRVYDPRDVEDHLQLPVFASVTRGE